MMWLLQYYASIVGVNKIREDIQTVTKLICALYPEKEVWLHIPVIILHTSVSYCIILCDCFTCLIALRV